MFIAAILLVQPKGYLEHRNWVGSQSPAEPISWIWIGWPRSTLGDWQDGILTHLILVTELLHIQFHWKLLITCSDFWLVNSLLQMFHNKKEIKKRNTRFCQWKKRKNVKKVYVNTKHSVHQGINPPSKTPPPSFLPSPLPQIDKLSKPVFLGNPPSILVFCEHPLKSQIFERIPPKLKFFILKACFRYFLSFFYFALQKLWKIFFIYLKSSFHFWDIQVFMFMSSPLFLPVCHCFRGWSKINLKVYDIINCLTKNFLTHFVWYLEKVTRYGIETLSIDRVLNKEHFYGKIMPKASARFLFNFGK